jgi:hypothetical protein
VSGKSVGILESFPDNIRETKKAGHLWTCLAERMLLEIPLFYEPPPSIEAKRPKRCTRIRETSGMATSDLPLSSITFKRLMPPEAHSMFVEAGWSNAVANNIIQDQRKASRTTILAMCNIFIVIFQTINLRGLPVAARLLERFVRHGNRSQRLHLQALSLERAELLRHYMPPAIAAA